MLAGYNLRQIPHHFGVQPKTDPLRCDMLRRFLFAHICRNSLFIICSLQNSSYCLLSTISGIFTINALLQQPCVPFHFDKQASFATSTPTNFCLQNHNDIYDICLISILPICICSVLFCSVCLYVCHLPSFK